MSNYKRLDEPLEIINTECIDLRTDEAKKLCDALKAVLNETITFMKDDDELFKKLFAQDLYDSSCFDDPKIGNPNEYDIDWKLSVPGKCEKTGRWDSCECLQVVPSNQPGFFWFELAENHCWLLKRFIRDGYVLTDLVLKWFNGLLTKALTHNTSGVRVVSQDTGSAVSLGLITGAGYVKVNLVPAFSFNETHWPSSPYRENPSEDYLSFLLIPKGPKGIQDETRFWRASFQQQERELINGKTHLKTALSLLKKMRLNLRQSDVPSYALTSTVLRNLDSFRWNSSLGDVFVALLKLYRNCLMSNEVPYYWNKRNNVLGGISEEIIKNHCDEISARMAVFDRKYRDDPWVVAELILKSDSVEYQQIKKKYVEVAPPSNCTPPSATPSPYPAPPSATPSSYSAPPRATPSSYSAPPRATWSSYSARPRAPRATPSSYSSPPRATPSRYSAPRRGTPSFHSAPRRGTRSSYSAPRRAAPCPRFSQPSSYDFGSGGIQNQQTTDDSWESLGTAVAVGAAAFVTGAALGSFLGKKKN